MAAAAGPVPTRFRAALDKVYGERIERVVLFGSRARGDARPDSDYDVLVFLKGSDQAARHEEMGRFRKSRRRTGYRRIDFRRFPTPQAPTPPGRL
jgi:predicted nucleotidyltransferase